MGEPGLGRRTNSERGIGERQLARGWVVFHPGWVPVYWWWIVLGISAVTELDISLQKACGIKKDTILSYEESVGLTVNGSRS